MLRIMAMNKPAAVFSHINIYEILVFTSYFVMKLLLNYFRY